MNEPRFIAILILIFGAAIVSLGSLLNAQSQTARNPIPAAAICAYNSSPPTGTSGTFILVQCDSTGKLKVQ